MVAFTERYINPGFQQLPGQFRLASEAMDNPAARPRPHTGSLGQQQVVCADAMDYERFAKTRGKARMKPEDPQLQFHIPAAQTVKAGLAYGHHAWSAGVDGKCAQPGAPQRLGCVPRMNSHAIMPIGHHRGAGANADDGVTRCGARLVMAMNIRKLRQILHGTGS